MIADRKLTANFSLYELTETLRKEFQEENRELTDKQISKLQGVAKLLEQCRESLCLKFEKPVPIKVNSGYRCKKLNDAIGSTDRSQHLPCEAADIVPKGVDLGEAFRHLWHEIEAGRLHVGQLIHETAARSYGETSWIHVSMGFPWRARERCGQILRMEGGKYTLLEIVA